MNAMEVFDDEHKRFMAMADAALGPDYDRGKLAKVEAFKLAMEESDLSLWKALEAHQIDRKRYLDEYNRSQLGFALQMEAVLGKEDFMKFFGMTPHDTVYLIDRETFLNDA